MPFLLLNCCPHSAVSLPTLRCVARAAQTVSADHCATCVSVEARVTGCSTKGAQHLQVTSLWADDLTFASRQRKLLVRLQGVKVTDVSRPLLCTTR